MSDYKELEKEMSGKGSAEVFPKGSGSLDSEADVKKKDASVYKEVEKKSEQG